LGYGVEHIGILFLPLLQLQLQLQPLKLTDLVLDTQCLGITGKGLMLPHHYHHHHHQKDKIAVGFPVLLHSHLLQSAPPVAAYIPCKFNLIL
jgi:hypothetical protein